MTAKHTGWIFEVSPYVLLIFTETCPCKSVTYVSVLCTADNTFVVFLTRLNIRNCFDLNHKHILAKVKDICSSAMFSIPQY